MKTQLNELMKSLDKTEIAQLTSVVEEKFLVRSRDKKFTVAEFDRIVKQRRVFHTRRFISNA